MGCPAPRQPAGTAVRGPPRGVDGHRRRDLVKGYASEELTHVIDRVDGDPDLAYLSRRDRRIGVVAHLGGQVKGNRKTRSPVCDQLAIAGIGLRGGAEARVLAHGPRPGGVHRRVDAARVRIVAGLTERKIRIEFGEILRPVDGLEWRSRLRLCTHLGIVACIARAAARSRLSAPTELCTRATADSIMRAVSACQFGSWPR